MNSSRRPVELPPLIKDIPDAPNNKNKNSYRYGRGPVDPEVTSGTRHGSRGTPIEEWHCEESLNKCISQGSDNEADLLTAKKVPGKKNIVSTAIAFIAEESRLVSRAISRLCSERRALSLLPILVFLTWSWRRSIWSSY